MRDIIACGAILAAGTALTLALALTNGAPAIGQGKPLPPEYRAYLTNPGISGAEFVVAPVAGSVDDKLDRAYFKKTRALEKTTRWQLATSDSGRGVLKAFSCAAGIALDNNNAPALVTLLSRYRTDLITATRVSEAARTSRPYERDKGAVCIADKPLATAIGTPAIQSAWGWTVAMIISEGLPDRTGPLMARGRAYGDSAAVCGFASASEVNGGRDLAAAMLARSRAEPGFRADLDVARAQLAALHASGTAPAPADCAAEAQQLAIKLR
jgi:acid phosphatase (class A)